MKAAELKFKMSHGVDIKEQQGKRSFLFYSCYISDTQLNIFSDFCD